MSEVINKIDETGAKIKDAISAMPEAEQKQSRGVAKYFSLILLGVLTAVGIVGSIPALNFDMAKYVSFLSVFALPIVTLIVSIGFGTAAGTIVKGLQK